jgi:NAD(P)H-hydrate repair Nnr-like enzyme with NAD(P)H-hydrate dehydratase domain
MENTFWHQQANNKPLYPDILWNQPEFKSLAGKLGIIGGSLQGFNSVSTAYDKAVKAGIGVARTILPNSLAKTIGPIWQECEFAPSTKSGGFSSKAINEWLNLTLWADGILISGELSRNSETSILLERFVTENKTQLTLAGDSLTLLIDTPNELINNKLLTIAIDLNQLQHLLTTIRYPTAIKSTMNLYQIVNLLHSFTYGYGLAVILIHEEQIILSHKGQVATMLNTKNIDSLTVATTCSVWRLQQPNKPFEAMATGIYYLLKD